MKSEVKEIKEVWSDDGRKIFYIDILPHEVEVIIERFKRFKNTRKEQFMKHKLENCKLNDITLKEMYDNFHYNLSLAKAYLDEDKFNNLKEYYVEIINSQDTCYTRDLVIEIIDKIKNY
jgi:hypothetical protein